MFLKNFFYLTYLVLALWILSNIKPVDKSAVLSPKISRFIGKHLYRNGSKDSNGNAYDSFKEITSNPNEAKEYIMRLNRKLPNDAILPKAAPNQFQRWFEKTDGEMDGKIDRRDISIIDSSYSEITADAGLKKEFQHWKNWTALPFWRVDLDDNQVKKTPTSSYFSTSQAYSVTNLTFHRAGQNPTTVNVKAEKLMAKLVLGLDMEGQPDHLESLKDKQTLETPETVCTFTIPELQTIAETTKRFYKHLGVQKQRGGLFDEDQLEQEFAIYKILLNTGLLLSALTTYIMLQNSKTTINSSSQLEMAQLG